MHIAIGITLRHRVTGEHYKINVASGGIVKLHDEVNAQDTAVPIENMALVFEEFGPTYEHVTHQDDGPPIMTEVHLGRCPFCGSTHLDPASWMSDADVNNTGPGCMDCGATAESTEAWNRRYAPDRLEDVLPASRSTPRPEMPVFLQGKYDNVLIPFIAMMESELHANSHKGDRPGWLSMTHAQLLVELHYHTSKLHYACHHKKTREIGELAADVANCAMMVYDGYVGFSDER